MRTTMILAVAALLTACGGGGSEDVSTEQQLTLKNRMFDGVVWVRVEGMPNDDGTPSARDGFEAVHHSLSPGARVALTIPALGQYQITTLWLGTGNESVDVPIFLGEGPFTFDLRH